MTDLTKIAGSHKHSSALSVGDLIVTVTLLFSLIAVQGLSITKHQVALNADAELAALGVIFP
jgi:hypothetical protein